MKKKISLFILLFLLALTVNFQTTNAAAKKNTYMIKVNKQKNTVTVYRHKKKGKYKPYKAFVCSSGKATPVGTFSLGGKYRWHALVGPSYGQYCTRIYGSFLFHSVWYYQPKKNTQSYAQFNRLGTTASHGCIRLTVADSKWIYDHCPSGTKVVIYNSSKVGPLGKPKAQKVSGHMGWDPTDPDVHNPYLVKVKSIKLSHTKKTLKIGGKKKEAKFTLRVKKILPKKAMIKKVKYTSSNKKIATVNQKGVVIAKRKGTCKIFVETTDGSKIKKVCKITVKQVEKKPIVVPTPTPTPTFTPIPTPTFTPKPSPTAEPTPTSTPGTTLN